MKIEKINKAYFEDYPFSYGGKYGKLLYPSLWKWILAVHTFSCTDVEPYIHIEGGTL